MSAPRATVEAPPAPPPAKDVPWWGALILAILTALVSVVATIYYLRGSAPSVPGAPPGMGKIFTDAITFLPHILILFGVFADIFTLQGAYSIPSLVGLMSIPIHYVLQFLWSGVAAFLGDIYKLATTVPAGTTAPTSDKSAFSFTNPIFKKKSSVSSILPPASPASNTQFDKDVKSLLGGMRGGAMSAWTGCEIYGFEGMKSPYAPQGLVVTSTIFWFYLLDLWMNRHGLDSVATALAFPLFFGLQAWQLSTCEDFSESVAIKSAIALAEGLIIGGTGYGIVQVSIPDRLPSSVLPTVPRLSSMTRNPDGSYTDSSGNQYIVGPDGRPISKKFLAQAANPISNTADGVGGVLKSASATSCPK
jgi:hypothetical protein